MMVKHIDFAGEHKSNNFSLCMLFPIAHGEQDNVEREVKILVWIYFMVLFRNRFNCKSV